MENYPKNFEEFLDRFQTDDDCAEYIKQRWLRGTHQGAVNPLHLQE